MEHFTSLEISRDNAAEESTQLSYSYITTVSLFVKKGKAPNWLCIGVLGDGQYMNSSELNLALFMEGSEELLWILGSDLARPSNAARIYVEDGT